MTPRNCDRPLQAIEKESPVGKVGQPIVERAMLQQGFGPLAFGDVTVDDHQSLRLAIRARNRTRRGLKNTPRAISVANAVFETISATR